MKAIIDSLSSEAVYRLKSPLIGSFIFAWCIINYKFLLAFVLSENAARLELINDLPIGWVNGIIYPIMFAIGYMFFVPLFQWRLDIVKYQLIDKRRTETLNKQLLDKYQGQSSVAKEKSRTTAEYWSELHRNHVESAGKKIVDLKAEIARLSRLLSEQESQLTAEKTNYEKLFNSDQTNAQLLQDTKKEVEELNDKIDSMRKDSSTLRKAVDSALAEIENSDDELLPTNFFNSEYEAVVIRMNNLTKRLLTDNHFNNSQSLQKKLLGVMHEQNSELNSTFEAIEDRVEKSTQAYNKALNILIANRHGIPNVKFSPELFVQKFKS
ncbi:hypothetical protein [Vibrio sp. NH-UV-68]|uniref:hypothetical protein n=1 Tax=unclassified Vibrio TaxID=2614977 RepID=UPI0036F35BAD